MVDHNFDDIADKFTHHIYGTTKYGTTKYGTTKYGTTKGKIREAVIWQDLNSLLNFLPNKPLKILDTGGGGEERFFCSQINGNGTPSHSLRYFDNDA